MAEQFIDNEKHSRFEYHVDDTVVFANYRKHDGSLYIDYVEAPPQLRGTGAAGKIMEQIVTVAKDENLNLVPICGYAASWLKRHDK
jgi:predicted GNAT family acetyltransferase